VPAAASAQGLLLPAEEAGGGVFAGTTLNADAADVSVGAVATPIPRLDVTGAIAWVPGSHGPTLMSLGAEVWLLRNGPTRVGVFTGIEGIVEPSIEVKALTLGVQVGEHAQIARGVVVVPSASISLSAVKDSGTLWGTAVAFAGGIPVRVEGDGIGAFLGPTFAVTPEEGKVYVGIQGGVLLF